MSGRYARELKRIWGGYRITSFSTTEREFKSFLEKTKGELRDKYLTYQAIGLALHKLAPIDKENQNEKIRFFWKIADEWNPEIRRCFRHWQKAMQK